MFDISGNMQMFPGHKSAEKCYCISKLCKNAKISLNHEAQIREKCHFLNTVNVIVGS